MITNLTKAVLIAVLMSGCAQHAAQTTSGTAYLERYASTKQTGHNVARAGIRDGKLTEVEVATVSTDDLVRRAASVEPLLRLPARIGLARIENGTLTTIPSSEAVEWHQLGDRHQHLGALVPVDPFLANYVQQTILPQDRTLLRRDAHGLLTKIRLGAARQHMDAVLIYEIGGRGEATEGLSPIRVLGAAPLPPAPIVREGVARAFLMDVRNGYPYGTASASADLGDLDTDWWQSSPRDRQGIAAKSRIAKALKPEVEAMFSTLINQMQARLASSK